MTEEKKNRISELTRISRERALTPEETAERLALREEYLADWRRGTLETLENVYIIGADGKARLIRRRETLEDLTSTLVLD